MAFTRQQVSKYLLLAHGNVVKAEVLCIAHEGCGQFRCKQCPLTLVCDHQVEHAQGLAIKCLGAAEQEELARKKQKII